MLIFNQYIKLVHIEKHTQMASFLDPISGAYNLQKFQNLSLVSGEYKSILMLKIVNIYILIKKNL